jgi:hypothetical protein
LRWTPPSPVPLESVNEEEVMRESPKIMTVLLCTVVASGIAFAQERALDPKLNVRDGEPLGEGFHPLPRPITPPETGGSLPVIGNGFQLVGFTTETFDGTRGILNLTLACQEEFPASRICSADDIRTTVNVPPAPGVGSAWIDVPRGSIDVSRSSVRATLDDTSNCRGWRSSASTDSGMAIDLEAAYGSLVRRTCDQRLRVACCMGK